MFIVNYEINVMSVLVELQLQKKFSIWKDGIWRRILQVFAGADLRCW